MEQSTHTTNTLSVGFLQEVRNLFLEQLPGHSQARTTPENGVLVFVVVESNSEDAEFANAVSTTLKVSLIFSFFIF